jgi:hypothetical protein
MIGSSWLLHVFSLHLLYSTFIVSLFIPSISSVLMVVACSRNGFGRHYWNVNPLRVTELLKVRYKIAG